MAVFGNLSKFSLREILAVVGDRAGILSIETGAARGMRLRLRVVNERLTSLVLERSVDSSDEVRVLLKRFANGQGDFRFETEVAGDDEAEDSLLPWEEVLSCLDGQQGHRDDLPHPQTRFILLKGRTASSHPDLDAFLRLARPLLERGSNAEQLAKELNMEQKEVQQLLQRLREMKKIWPVRAYTEEPASSEQRQEKTLVAKRLTDLFAP